MEVFHRAPRFAAVLTNFNRVDFTSQRDSTVNKIESGQVLLIIERLPVHSQLYLCVVFFVYFLFFPSPLVYRDI